MLQERNDVNIKINESPQGRPIITTITVKPKVWQVLTNAATNYLQRIVAIHGRFGQLSEHRFLLHEPNIQVFERKPKDKATILPLGA